MARFRIQLHEIYDFIMHVASFIHSKRYCRDLTLHYNCHSNSGKQHINGESIASTRFVLSSLWNMLILWRWRKAATDGTVAMAAIDMGAVAGVV